MSISSVDSPGGQALIWEWPGIVHLYTIMCGITGVIFSGLTDYSEAHQVGLGRRLQKMTDTLRHRGPDGEGFWLQDGGRLGFGHRRLSIIDLSPEAAQPMHYLDRYTLVYNGELYNYLELKAELQQKGYRFRTQSDAEVLLACYDCYREGCLDHFDGMFAFGLWDEREQTLFAARDRFGEKPFYYALDEHEFAFASERKALWAGGVEKKVNQPLLYNYLVLGYTQTAADRTIGYFQDVFSLPAAHYLLLHGPSFRFSLHAYWDLDKESRISRSDLQATEQFRELFFLSVKRRLRSNVSVGSSLSGGLDSSSIVAAIRHAGSGPHRLQSFSAVFPGFEKDESRQIHLVEQQFGIDNYQVAPGPADLIENLDRLCYHQEEPFGSASVYAQFRVFELARQHQTTVLLDGQGADEILAGYARYLPWYLQELIRSRPLGLVPAYQALKRRGLAFEWGWKNFAAAWFPAQAANQLEKREARRLRHSSQLIQEFKRRYYDRPSLIKPLVLKLNDVLYFDSIQSGLDDLLRYADRNSMAFGREVRLPFLNHDLVQFVFSLPSSFKIRDGWTKWLLRSAMQQDLPAPIVWRTDKVGFEPPQKSWMQSPLVEERIIEAKKKLVAEGILRREVLDKKIQPRSAYEADNADWRYLIAATCMGPR